MLGEQALSIRPIGSMIQGIHNDCQIVISKIAAADPPSKTMRLPQRAGMTGNIGRTRIRVLMGGFSVRGCQAGKTEIPKTYFVQVSNDAR